MSRKKAEAHINHERWMVSFADFMTLLFSLFVVLFAISSVDQTKFRKVADSVNKAFGVVPNKGAGLVENDPGQPGPINLIPIVFEHHPQMVALDRQIRSTLSQDSNLRDAIQMRYESRGLIIQLKDSRLFESGSFQLRPAIMPALKRLVQQHLQRIRNKIRIEGHTDNVPMGGGMSNWELSAARAATVLRFVQQSGGISPNRLSLAGYGEFSPIATNMTPEGRARNRRVDIVVLSTTENRKEPGETAAERGSGDDLNTKLNTRLELEHRR